MRNLVLADDSTTIQKVIQLSFASEDYKIHTFSNGTGALGYLRNYGCDIVLADISLPHLDGYELCREIRQDPRTAEIPVVLLAGTFEPFDADRALDAGYTSLLIKPFETGKLVELVKTLVGRSSPSQDAPGAPEQEETAPEVAPPDEAEPVSSESVAVEPAELDPFPVPVPQATGTVLLSLSPEQCRSELREKTSESESAGLSPEQMELLVDRVMERMPGTLRSVLPELTREILEEDSALSAERNSVE